MMVCVDSNSRTPTDTFCFSLVLVHKRQFKLGSALPSGLKITISRVRPMETAAAGVWDVDAHARSGLGGSIVSAPLGEDREILQGGPDARLVILWSNSVGNVLTAD
jgi:hypothetical protein